MNEIIEEKVKVLASKLGVSVDVLKKEMDEINAPDCPDKDGFKYNRLVTIYSKQLATKGEVVSAIILGTSGMVDWSRNKRNKALLEAAKIGKEEAIAQKIIDVSGNVLEKYTPEHRQKISQYAGLLAQEGKPIKDFDVNVRYVVLFNKEGILTPGTIEIHANIPSYVKPTEDKLVNEEDILFSNYRGTLMKEYSLPNFTEINIKGIIKGDSLRIGKKPAYDVVKSYTYEEISKTMVTTTIEGLDAWDDANGENFNAFFVMNCIASTIDPTQNGSYMINFTSDGADLFNGDVLTEPVTGFMETVDFMESSPVIVVGKTNYKTREDQSIQKGIRVYSVLTEDIYRRTEE